MALFYPAAALASAWIISAGAITARQIASEPIENASQKPDEKEAFQGAWCNPRDWTFADTRGRFHSVQESRDVRGARIFLVDYGNGSRVVQFFDPRILL